MQFSTPPALPKNDMMLRLEVELRNKHSVPAPVVGIGARRVAAVQSQPPAYDAKNALPMEKVLNTLDIIGEKE